MLSTVRCTSRRASILATCRRGDPNPGSVAALLCNRCEPSRSRGEQNELILNSAKLNQRLPRSIMAFFFVKGTSPVTSDLGYAIMLDAVQVHRAFLSEYGLTESDVPLLILDPANWDAPFAPYYQESE